MWSIGILTYELLFGQSPFAEKDNSEKTFSNILEEEVKFPGLVSFEGVEFIKKLLVKKPGKRMGLGEALKHRFIVNNLSNRNI